MSNINENTTFKRVSPTNDDKMLALVLYIVGFFTVSIAAILIWAWKKEESTFIEFHGKQFFNYFFSFLIYAIIIGMIVKVIGLFGAIPIIGLLFKTATIIISSSFGIFTLVLVIIAAVKAYEGQKWVIPFVFKFFS